MQRGSILIIEREPIISYDMQLEFMAMGYRVFLADDIQDAEAICKRIAPEKIIINFHQRSMVDGWSLCRRLQRDFGADILIVTGSRSDDVIQALDFAGSIQKVPFTLSFLGITLTGRYVPWLAIRSALRYTSVFLPIGRHHCTALMRRNKSSVQQIESCPIQILYKPFTRKQLREIIR